MPLSRDLGHGLREVRTRLIGRRIARTLFHVERNEMVLLHGFIKKSQRTPLLEIRVAQQRLAEVLNER